LLRIIAYELQLFNLIAREDTKASIELTKTSKRLTEANLAVARAAKNDSGAMKTISVMTMLFLPATFIAALFTMPTLHWDESRVIQNKFWVYWAFTIPITLLIFLVWTGTTYRASTSYPLTPEHSTNRICTHDGPGRRRFKGQLQSDANVECG
jgi:heme/copper-type cytochrome/quinol oxidase subunit 2